jgi:hypothetical protein
METPKELELTSEQEKQMLDLWNKNPSSPPGLKEITKEIFGGDFDGRSAQGRAVKKSLLKFNLRAKATSDYTPKTAEVQLTEEQKQFIINNVATMNSLEISKILFQNPTLTNLNAETRAVNDFVKTLDTKVVYNQNQNDDIPTEDYQPPATLEKVLRRVNKYVNCNLDKEKLNNNQRKGLEALINYLHTFRFIRQMNTYDSQDDRTLCEDAFIRYTYDKPDLNQEEVDQYIELSNQVVQGFKVLRRSERMQFALEQITGNDPETMKVSMGLVEAIGKASTEYDQCIKRQQKLLDDLKEKRSTRLSKQIKETASILNLVQLWRDEEERIKMIKYAEIEQQAVAQEVEKLTSMEDIKARIFGLDKNEILNG